MPHATFAIVSVQLVPCRTDPRRGQVNHEAEHIAQKMLERAARCLADINTPYEDRDDRLAIQVA